MAKDIFDDDPLFKKLMFDFLNRASGNPVDKEYQMFDMLMSESNEDKAIEQMMAFANPVTFGETIAEHLRAAQKDMPAADEASLASEVFVRVTSHDFMPVSVRQSIQSMARQRKSHMSIWKLPEEIFRLIGYTIPTPNEESFGLTRVSMINELKLLGFRYSHFEAFSNAMKFVDAVDAIPYTDVDKVAEEMEKFKAVLWYASSDDDFEDRPNAEKRYLAILAGQLPDAIGLTSIVDSVYDDDPEEDEFEERIVPVISSPSNPIVLKSTRPERDAAFYAHFFGFEFEPAVDEQRGHVWAYKMGEKDFFLLPTEQDYKAQLTTTLSFEYSSDLSIHIYLSLRNMDLGTPEPLGKSEKGHKFLIRDMSGNVIHLIQPFSIFREEEE